MQVGVERVLEQDLGREGHWKVKRLSKELVIVPYKITRAGHLLWGGKSLQQASVLS